MTNAEKIAELEASLTGDMFADMKLKGGNAPLMILSARLVGPNIISTSIYI